MDRNVTAFALAFLLCVGHLYGGTRFDGSWSASADKHSFTVDGLSVASLRLETRGDVLHETLQVAPQADGRTLTLQYRLDGDETSNDLAGRKTRCRAWRQGAQLVIEWRWEDSTGLRRIFTEGDEGVRMLIQHFEPGRLDMNTIGLRKVSK